MRRAFCVITSSCSTSTYRMMPRGDLRHKLKRRNITSIVNTIWSFRCLHWIPYAASNLSIYIEELLIKISQKEPFDTYDKTLIRCFWNWCTYSNCVKYPGWHMSKCRRVMRNGSRVTKTCAKHVLETNSHCFFVNSALAGLRYSLYPNRMHIFLPLFCFAVVECWSILPI